MDNGTGIKYIIADENEEEEHYSPVIINTVEREMGKKLIACRRSTAVARTYPPADLGRSASPLAGCRPPSALAGSWIGTSTSGCGSAHCREF